MQKLFDILVVLQQFQPRWRSARAMVRSRTGLRNSGCSSATVNVRWS